MVESWHAWIVQEHEPFGAKCDWVQSTAVLLYMKKMAAAAFAQDFLNVEKNSRE